MSDFYVAFENEMRGSRELIKSRLAVYLPFLECLLAVYPNAQGVDIGCGRGEWLELAQSAGIEIRGVDTDKGMVAYCQELDLPVEEIDGLAYLKGLADQSQTVISAFHVVEHMPFEALLDLVNEALRVLKPGGLLIMETPNPENLAVGSANFYIDPTHQKPIPWQLLNFIPRHAGFHRAKTLRLQESKTATQSQSLSLFHVLTGVSPDYAVIAQKEAEIEALAGFQTLFEKEFGLGLDQLAALYDKKQMEISHVETQAAIDAQFRWLQSDWHEALQREKDLIAENAVRKEKLKHLQARLNEIEAAKLNQQQQITRLNHRLNQQTSEYENRLTQLNEQLMAVYHSTSWRITWPLRKSYQLIRYGIRAVGSAFGVLLRLPKRLIKSTILFLARIITRYEFLSRLVKTLLNLVPPLRNRLIRFIEHQRETSSLVRSNTRPLSGAVSDALMRESTVQTRKVYRQLAAGLDAKRKLENNENSN